MGEVNIPPLNPLLTGGDVGSNRCLLITGTVIPNSNYVSHKNVEERLKEYHNALVYYSTHFSGESIYFLENSAYDFSSNPDFNKLFSEKVITLMKFPVSDKYEQGKGFQEFEMLDKAVDKLNGNYHSFIKITGRYIVRNLKQILGSERNGIMIDRHKKTRVAHTNVFSSTFDFYNNYLKGLYKSVNDGKGIIIERLVYDKIKSSGVDSQVKLFPKNLQIEGISGSYGLPLKRNNLKMRIRNIERKLLRLAGINEFLMEY